MLSLHHFKQLDLDGGESRQGPAQAGCQERASVGGDRQPLLKSSGEVAEQERSENVDRKRRPGPAVLAVHECLSKTGPCKRADDSTAL
jgi:hypothetical protein